MREGCVEIYYGSGKGKTTAALGAGLRSIGHGQRVVLVQFLKTRPTGELVSLRQLAPLFQVIRPQNEHGFYRTLSEEEKRKVVQEEEAVWERVQALVSRPGCEMLILDEVLGAVENEILSEQQVTDLIQKRPKEMEIILTGRRLPESIARCADYITEMRKVRHPYDRGLTAREGIEY